jgi:hypothetical protein
MSSVHGEGRPRGCLSREPWLLAKLRDVTPAELGKVATRIREFLASLQFHEVILSPLETRPIDYLNNPIDVEGIGQLRFNTEPEIWDSSRDYERYYSISTLFRRETVVNALRRSAFFIVDLYQPGPPETMLPIFEGLLAGLADEGYSQALSKLPLNNAQYDSSIDGPSGSFDRVQWVITSGYDAGHSFFELDEQGRSTRREIYFVTPFGFLEIGVLGITGWNKNPDYALRTNRGKGPDINPDLRRSGLCIGLERLLLAEQIAFIARESRR